MAAVAAEERDLSGRLSGWLYLTGAVTLGPIVLLPGVPRAHWRLVLTIAVLAGIWGFASARLIRWNSAPTWLIHVSNTAGFAVIAAAIAATGGAGSPARPYFFFVVVFSSYFYRPRVALLYLLGCGLVDALPLLYHQHALANGFVGQLAIAAPGYFAVGGAVIAGKALLLQLRGHAERLAAEQGALRRVATAVASGSDPEATYSLVADEVAGLLDADASGVLRFDSSERAVVMGAGSNGSGGRYEPGTVVPVRPGSNIAALLATAAPVRVDNHEPGSPTDRLGYACSVLAPVNVGGELWGFLAIADEIPGALPADAEQRLTVFGDLVATAIANTEDRASLAARAATDPLTGLGNHRAFHERLEAEVARATRHGRAMSVAVIDIDYFKQVNDSGGHELGDRTLAALSETLKQLARTEDTLARVGGDEFAWLLPEADALEALHALERAQRVIAQTPLAPTPITISAGICDLSATQNAERLLELADGALYWSKAHGRNLCRIYHPDIVRELSAQERAEHLQRSQALLGLRALARAIDAKDPKTRQHSERVAALATKLTRTAGWSNEQIQLLSEAALLHDVGKIGVPDAVLLKAGPLADSEFEQIKLHAELSAQIVQEVLAPEQVAWIRAHHERADGRGYPRGLTEQEIPEGAALLAVADAYDVMTLSRPYSRPKSKDEALAECRSLVGRQFKASAVAALLALDEAGDLAPPDSRPETVGAGVEATLQG